MADGKIIIDARISTTQAEKSAKALKAQAEAIAKTYQKQGLNMEQSMEKAWKDIERDAKQGAKNTRKHINKEFAGAAADLKYTLRKVGTSFFGLFSAISIGRLVTECIELGSAVEEVQNVVDTAFGNMAYKMEEFADKAITSFGISQLAAKQTGSNYMAMARGMGIAEDAASDMAIALTGLSADVASFYNITQEEAATKLKSVFTGETETLKDLGVVMTQTNLEQYALTKGIKKSISAMSQAELTTLRYSYVLDSLSMASGDFVRTQDSWANQTRILSEQMKQLGANVGTILTTILLPAVKTINEIVADLVEATNAVVDAIKVLKGNTADQNNATASSAYAAAEAENALADGILNAADAAKKSQAGFDELNILSAKDSSGGYSVTNTGTTSAPSTTSTGKETTPESAKNLLQDVTKYAGLAVSALGGLKIGGFISELVDANTEAKTLKDMISLLGKKLTITGGITLAVTGIALEGAGIYDAITEGLDLSNLGDILLGGTGLTGGLSLALSKMLPEITVLGKTISGGLLGGAIGGMAAGIPMFATGIYDSLKGKISWMSASLTAIGSTAAGAGIGAIIGSLGGPIGTGVGALIGLVVGAVTDLTIWLVQNWDSVEVFFSEFCANVGKFFSVLWTSIRTLAVNAWNGIRGVYSSVSGWINASVVQPVSRFFSTMWNGLISGAKSAWEGIKSAFSTAAAFFRNTFANAWAGVVRVFSTAGEIFTNIKDGILIAFKSVVNGIIRGLNNVIAVPFNGINSALSAIRGVKIMGLSPFAGVGRIAVPQIPYLAQGAVIPPNREFLAVLGDQTSGTNIEAPLSTIQEAVSIVMEDLIQSTLAGHEAILAVLKDILEAVLGIEIGDDTIAQAVARYNMKMAVVRGG